MLTTFLLKIPHSDTESDPDLFDLYVDDYMNKKAAESSPSTLESVPAKPPPHTFPYVVPVVDEFEPNRPLIVFSVPEDDPFVLAKIVPDMPGKYCFPWTTLAQNILEAKHFGRYPDEPTVFEGVLQYFPDMPYEDLAKARRTKYHQRQYDKARELNFEFNKNERMLAEAKNNPTKKKGKGNVYLLKKAPSTTSASKRGNPLFCYVVVRQNFPNLKILEDYICHGRTQRFEWWKKGLRWGMMRPMLHFTDTGWADCHRTCQGARPCK